jgi:hypothetical protein
VRLKSEYKIWSLFLVQSFWLATWKFLTSSCGFHWNLVVSIFC